MENNETFKMTYSAQQQEEVVSIRKKYMLKEESKLEQLRALDAGVTGRATGRAIAVGVVGALLLGTGMSLVMTDFGVLLGAAALPLGIAVGAVGIAAVALAYPLYERTLKKERARIAPEILKLTDELMQ